MKKLGLALILTALVAFAAVATASARTGGATTSSATPQTSSHSDDSGPGEHGDGHHGDDDDGHHGDGHHGDDDGDRREAGEDIRGNCDEAEHARDAHCVGVAASTSKSGATNSSSSATNSSSGATNSSSGATNLKRVAVGTKLIANVGPGYSITLKTAKGAAVKALRAGTYTVTVRDRSDEHNFRLSGKGFNKATSVAATTTQTWRVQFKAGTYTFQCEPHAEVMRGTLRVS